MKVVRIICPHCGIDQIVPLIECRLVLTDWDSTALFRCDTCGQVERAMDPDQVTLLVNAGVRTIRHHCEPHTGPRISYDDLLDFHDALGRLDCLASVAT